MPGGDRTGPQGMGPMTGRAAGYCASNPTPGYAFHGFGRGYGARGGWGYAGRGWGWRNMYYANGLPGWARYGEYAPFCPYPNPYGEADADAAKQALKNQADTLQAQLDLVKKHLSDLETGATTE
jgi:ribosomal protein L15